MCFVSDVARAEVVVVLLRFLATVIGFVLVIEPGVAFANGYGESAPWQFQSSASMANMAVVEDMIQKKAAGAYGPAQYSTTINNTNSTTNIAKQVNCSLTATAYGNYAIPGVGAGSPITSGAAPSAIGNTNAATGNYSGAGTVTPNNTNGQTNSGAVSSNLNGATTVSTTGPYYQALNSTQTNSGVQTASVANSSACTGTVN